MNITFIDPLSRGWGRMKKALFQPFDISKWFVVGFTAFLAGLTECHKGGNCSTGGGDYEFGDVLDFPYIAWEWLMDHPGWFMLILFGVVASTLFIILLTWLSSRGKFMFLDNVVHDRAQVVKPWYDFRKQGNSLFLWRLCFGFIFLTLFILFLVQCFMIATDIYEGNYPPGIPTLLIIGMVFFALFLFIITSYISLFLNDFIVPIMYKNTLTTNQAWGRFLSLFTRYWLYFILYGLFVFVLNIVVIICVILAGIFTCCLGFLLLIIPYIGSVVTLPISYTFRAFSLEFLEQFGSEFLFFQHAEENGND
jgi:MFS family permease